MQQVSSQEDYSKNGMMVKTWGPAGWVFLHCIAQNYPQQPTSKQQIDYFNFFKMVGNVLPCRYCRDSYQQYIKEPSTLLNKNVMSNRQTMTRWLYDIHNKVNKKLEVTDIPTFEEVTEKYESFRSKCTKSPNVIEKIVKKGCTDPLSGYRKKCQITFVDVDEKGNPIQRSSFGKMSKTTLKSVKRSTKSGKKYTATFERNGKTKIIHFGSKGMGDFVKYSKSDKSKAIKHRNSYIFRHHKDLGTGDPTRAGYLSMFILWNKPSLSSSIADYRRRLNIYNNTGKFPTNISGYKSPGKKGKYQ